MGSHCTQSRLLPDFPGPPLSLLDAPNMSVGTPPLPTLQCGQNRVEGHHTQLPLLPQPLLPAVLAP